MADDKYNLFETTVDGDIKFINFTLRKREIALIGAVTILGLCCTIMVLVMVVGMHAASPFCETADCLGVASSLYSNMNKSLDPCDDFYTYACNGWSARQRLQPSAREVTIYSGMRRRNLVKLYRLLYDRGSKTGTEAEQKIKRFFHSCTDNYARMKASGAAFIDKVVKPMGGWNVLDNQQAAWNYNEALKKVHVDSWTVALFNFWVRPDPHRPSRGIIEVSDGSVAFNQIINSIYITLAFQVLDLNT